MVSGNPSVSFRWLLSVSHFYCYEDAQRSKDPTTDEEKALPDAVIIFSYYYLFCWEGERGAFSVSFAADDIGALHKIILIYSLY